MSSMSCSLMHMPHKASLWWDAANEKMVYCTFSSLWAYRKTALLRGMMHWHIRSDECAQNQFLNVFLLWFACSGNFWTYPKLIFGTFKNTQNRNSLMEIFAYVWNWFSEHPKMIVESKNRFCKFLELSETIFRNFWKCLWTQKRFWKFLDLSERNFLIFENIQKDISEIIFRNFRKSQLLCITGRSGAAAINSSLPSLVRAAGDIGYFVPLACSSWDSLLSLAFLFPLSPVFNSDFVCVWELWIRVCVSTCC